MSFKTKASKISKASASTKASLSLSINAIVVLILAIAMLGLGLGFTKQQFAKFGDKLVVPPPDYPATAEESIVLPADNIEVSSTKDTFVTINVYSSITQLVSPTSTCSCVKSDATAGGAPVSTATVPFPPTFTGQNIDGGKYKGFKAIIPKGGISGSSCLCTIQYTDNSLVKARQITLKII